MARSSRRTISRNAKFWVLVSFVILAFVAGGGARSDVLSNIVLRPAAAIFLGVGLWSLSWRDVKAFRFLFVIAMAIICLTLLQLVPLPPSVWQALPGRDIIAEADRAAGLGAVWRPVSIVPPATWNALYSILIPAAALVWAVQIDQEQRFRLITPVLIIGLISGLLGMLQAVGPDGGPLYLYRVTNNGAAVGLFANRNHQAVFLACLFPMLAVFASSGLRSVDEQRFRGWLAIAGGAFLVPLLLVTGSRAGIVTGAVGIIISMKIYRTPSFLTPAKRKGNRFDARFIYGGFGLVGLVALTILMSRASALDRLAAGDETADLRLKIWGPILDMAWKYFPVGSGAGSFVETYQIDEPQALLQPNYVNHAHNDWLEVFLTTGVLGIVLLAVVAIAWGKRALRLFWNTPNDGRITQYGRLGAALVFIMGLASFADYPLRVPSLMCLFVLSACWMSENDATRTKKTGSG